MNMKAAQVLAAEKLGELATCRIPNRGQPTIVLTVGENEMTYGVGVTWEAAFAAADLLVAAQAQARLLFTNIADARYASDGRCEIGLMLYGQFNQIGSAGTFEAAIARASQTAAGAHAAEVLETIDAVQRRFGSVAKVTIGELYADCFVRRGQETLGYGASFVQALARAVAKDNQSLAMSRNRGHANRGKRVPVVRVKYTPVPKPVPPTFDAAVQARVEEMAAVGPLELNAPAIPTPDEVGV